MILYFKEVFDRNKDDQCDFHTSWGFVFRMIKKFTGNRLSKISAASLFWPLRPHILWTKLALLMENNSGIQLCVMRSYDVIKLPFSIYKIKLGQDKIQFLCSLWETWAPKAWEEWIKLLLARVLCSIKID